MNRISGRIPHGTNNFFFEAVNFCIYIWETHIFFIKLSMRNGLDRYPFHLLLELKFYTLKTEVTIESCWASIIISSHKVTCRWGIDCHPEKTPALMSWCLSNWLYDKEIWWLQRKRSPVISFIEKCSATSAAAEVRWDTRWLREIRTSVYAKGKARSWKPWKTQMNAQEWGENSCGWAYAYFLWLHLSFLLKCGLM